eukprot:TRINITY_DN503_c0_g1_i3.p1 TRINITY_DN503_c0_g1~~TRINITY_DN503_c0_g1_i3.p1  ORF type:complete len:498 (+),score=92.33 TRINITY_DN503_c0_g1_i3:300-1793(+)
MTPGDTHSTLVPRPFSSDADAEAAFVAVSLNNYRETVRITVVLEDWKVFDFSSQRNHDDDTHAHGEFDWVSLRCQNLFYRHVLRDPFCVDYPPPSPFSLKFIRAYVSAVEDSRRHGVLDELLEEVYGRMALTGTTRSLGAISSPDEPSNWGYKSYAIVVADLDAINQVKIVASKGDGKDDRRFVTHQQRVNDEDHESQNTQEEGTNEQEPEPMRVTSAHESMVTITTTVKTQTVGNLVGLTTWTAGFFLAELMLAQPGIVKGRRCVEFGSGVGLTGMVVARLNVESIVLTDFDDHVMSNLRENLRINGLEHRVGAMTLDWEVCAVDVPDPSLHNNSNNESTNKNSNTTDYHDDEDDEHSSEENVKGESGAVVDSFAQLTAAKPNLLLAADIAYDPDLIRIFVTMMRRFFRDARADGRPLTAYIATTKRNEKTLAVLVDELTKSTAFHTEDLTGCVARNVVPMLFRYDEGARDRIILHRLTWDKASRSAWPSDGVGNE